MSKNKPQCALCQYYRNGAWCSNSQSPSHRKYLADSESCGAFSERGKKAPAAMRAQIFALKKLMGR